MKATTEQLWHAYQELKSTTAVADKFGTTHSNVVQRLKALRRPGRRAWWQG